MEKKYQIFISSTYDDLKEERKKVQDTILSMYQFPIGMEMFSAANEEQWEIIKETIDSSDYYVLIIAHRYGSVIEKGEHAGISYTQKEYYYALEQKIPVLAFFIDNKVPVALNKMEQDPEKIKKLNAFKEKVKSEKTVEWWENKEDLAQKVSIALTKEISRGKRPGWVRAQSLEKDNLEREVVKPDKIEKELNDYKQEPQKKIIELNNKIMLPSIIKGKEKFIALLFIGVIAIVLLFSCRLFWNNRDKEKSQANVTVEMQEDNTQRDENIELSKGNTQEDKNAGLYENNDQEDKNKEDIQSLQENDNIIDWEYEEDVDNMRRYLKNTPSEMGIDVSYYQQTIDWKKVKADGIDFAIIRVGSRGYKYGNINLDSKFKENMDGAMANGIKIGVYFYSQAINQDEMDEEINEILKAIEGYNLDYPVVIELVCESDDYRTYELTTTEHQEEYINLIKYFCNRIKKNGYTPMIYGTIEWFQQFPASTFDEYYKWAYSSDSAPNNIENCVIWQYKRDTRGVVDGITHVSVNLSSYNGGND